jgi:peptidoglycan/xylan/chitin deacetylase (PgdA/CDA1 family)
MASKKKSTLKTTLDPQPMRNVAEKKRQLQRIRRWNAGLMLLAAFVLGAGSGIVGWQSWHSGKTPPVVVMAQPIGYGEGWDSLDAHAASSMSVTSVVDQSSAVAQPIPSLIQSTQKLGPSLHVPILMYHYIRVNPVATDKIGYGLSVTPADFESQMGYLAEHGFHSVSVGQVVDALHGKKTLPAKPVAITFDDGYVDLYSQAFPVLQKYGLHGESYVITGKVGAPGYVTWDMLKRMQQSGVVTVGAHTVLHPDLAELNADQQRNEILGSRLILQAQLDVPVDDFCYPSGKYSAETLEIVRQSGFKDAVTVESGSVEYAGQEFTLPRLRVEGGETLGQFIENLNN